PEGHDEEASRQEASRQEDREGFLMTDRLDDLIDRAESEQGDRYAMLIDIHDALREALAETDGDTAAAGR
ncbi:MAG: hypothetical protein KDB83_09100, partial [Actinobacteria bacterium]|nr:hypothetical protein [Actinomycetota bacterium]